ncbi:MAG TPA: TetR/AcrR family transcriptional regulator [Gaiellaceae bacterium]
MTVRDRSPKRHRTGSRGVPRAVREPLILDVAGRVFASRGYHAASMDEIAAEADVTKPLIYAYFGSKEGLYIAYIERSGRELLERMRTATQPTAPPRERLQTGILEFFRFVGERRDGWQVLYSEAASRGGPLAEEVATLRAAIARMITRLLMETIPDLRASDETTAALDAVAHAIVGAGESLANRSLAHPELPPERAAQLLVAIGQTGVEQTVAALDSRPAGSASLPSSPSMSASSATTAGSGR